MLDRVACNYRMDETAEDHGIVKDRDVNNDIETSLSEQKVVCEEEKDVIANGKDDIQSMYFLLNLGLSTFAAFPQDYNFRYK